MPEKSFFINLDAALTANQTQTLSYTVPTNEGLVIERIYQTSEGAADIVELSDSTGVGYSNASDGNGLNINVLPDLANEFHAAVPLPMPITLEGGVTFRIRVKDTSGSSNDVNVILAGRVTYE